MANNVINMFDRKPKENKEAEEVKDETELSFEEIAKKNKENAERLKRDRANANKKVTKSYNLK